MNCPKCGTLLYYHQKWDFWGCANYRKTGCRFSIEGSSKLKIPNETDIISDYINGCDIYHLSAKYLLLTKDIEIVIQRNDTDGRITKERELKERERRGDVFFCGWLADEVLKEIEQNYEEWLAKEGLIKIIENRSKYLISHHEK